ncbi:GNAT family N-acetyltransferase [Shewanella corallii]|uniref:GNAT family N-acetyltransferase n=1 Tax=Shewanella corallii TaxID=560080 RepID=A0ABT0NAD8_9GAMM|nr:GNAT family N-acetyltransferase [Shewanella corallii]MCL2915110.1 GNAT family N-acetyltransferase [Shewanella corallii]
MYASHIEHIELCSDEHLNTLTGLIEALPEFDSRHDLDALVSRLQGQPHLALLSFVEGELAGFKLGYALDDTTFYSWLGGVLPEFRNLGLAKSMLVAQESWAKTKGYQSMEVKTMNCYAPMLTMLVSNGYQVTALAANDDIKLNKMTLRKSL